MALFLKKKTQKLLETNLGIENLDEIKNLKAKLLMINTQSQTQEKRCLRSNVRNQEDVKQTSDKSE